MICLAEDLVFGADLANRSDISGFAIANVKRTDFPVELHPAFRRNLAIARNRSPVQLPPEALRIELPRDTALIVMAAKDAVMACIIQGLTGPDQCNVMAHFG